MMRKILRAMGCIAIIAGATACGGEGTTFDDEEGSSGFIPTTAEPSYVAAPGVTLHQVAIYQGVKRVLYDRAGTPPPSVKLVQGRDALVRVFYTTDDPAKVGQPVVGRLSIDGAEPIDAPGTLVPASGDADIQSTINFNVPGDLIGDNLIYNVAILEEGDGADNPNAIHPAPDVGESVPVEGARNVFRVVFVPFQYNADGSGRLPSVVDQTDTYVARLKQLYPVSDVEVVVREPVPWNQPILPNGQGWQEVGFQLYSIRQAEKPSEDWYYYAIFSPTQSVLQFCGGGCLLGVTLLNNDPPTTGDPALRIGLGVGFPEQGPSTAAHELGHAHGRNHAPCSPPGQPLPDGIDPQYPHPGAGIGTWGWDIVGQQLIDPAIHTDIMGYCDVQWISDYQFNKLLDRSAAVNLPKYLGPQRAQLPVQTVSIGIDGSATLNPVIMATPPEGPGNVDVTVRREDGSTEIVRAHFHPWDHMAGGMLVYADDRPAARVDAVVEGRAISAVR